MLAPKQRGDLARHTPEHEIGRVNNVPLTLDIAWFGAVCAHDRLPSLFSRLPHPERDGGLVLRNTPTGAGPGTAVAGAGLLLGRMSHVQSGRPGRECADDGAWIGTQLREFGAHGNSTHNDEISYPSTLTQVKARRVDRWDFVWRESAGTGSHP
ncbi:hypothetical protein GCM10009642_31490 [Nocardiopsis metallicus]